MHSPVFRVPFLTLGLNLEYRLCHRHLWPTGGDNGLRHVRHRVVPARCCRHFRLHFIPPPGLCIREWICRFFFNPYSTSGRPPPFISPIPSRSTARSNPAGSLRVFWVSRCSSRSSATSGVLNGGAAKLSRGTIYRFYFGVFIAVISCIDKLVTQRRLSFPNVGSSSYSTSASNFITVWLIER